MINILCALHAEAAPLLEHFELKKKNTALKFDLFENEASQIRLVLTGTGMVSAAAALSSLLTLFPPVQGDLLLNFGTCGGNAAAGTLILANKLVNSASRRTFYPDLLFSHSITEGTVITVPDVMDAIPEGQYADMEAAAIYEAAGSYLGPESMCFLKIVSDSGSTGSITPQYVRELISEKMEEISALISTLTDYSRHVSRSSPVDEEYFEALCEALHCSATMKSSLRQLLTYAKVSGTDASSLFAPLYADGTLPCAGKTEGKKIINEISTLLISR